MAATATPTSDLSTSLGANPGLERLYDNVQVQVPTATLALVKQSAWNAIETFYLRSTCRRELVYWQMASGVNQVDFNPFDENWLVAWVLAFDGLSYGKIEPPSLLRDVQYPASTSLRSGKAILALKPTSFSSEFDSLLFSQWFEHILDGALARLYAMPAKPFSSPQLATFHETRFRSGIAEARAFAQRSYPSLGGRWQFPYFAGGVRKQ